MVQLEQVAIRSGAFQLANLSLELPTGQYAVLMGKTGTGKTTILEAICGLRRILAGSVWLNGALQFLQIEQAFRVHWQKCDRTALLLKGEGELNIRGMLHRRGDDVSLARLACERAVERGVIALRPAAREDDLPGLGLDEISHAGPGAIQSFGELVSKRIGA